MNPRIQFSKSTARSLIVSLLGCFALSQTAQAVLPSPTPDGGYPGGNTAEGQNALFGLTTGVNNTAVGFDGLYHNTTGYYNTASGYGALFSNTTGFKNTAEGFRALYFNTTGCQNTVEGFQALYSNTTGFNNTAMGVDALFHNTTGDSNTATGYSALFDNTTGTQSTANGFKALHNNTTGSDNTANGSQALLHNTTGSGNTGNGAQALLNNTTGSNNTADGDFALYSNIGGNGNIALGFNSGFNLTTGNLNIDIGNTGFPGEADTIRIGTEGTQTATYVAGIYGETTGSTTTLPVIVDVNGQFGTAASSERFKTEVKPMDKTSEAILALKPVTFRYKNDSKGTAQFGLIAEEVGKVDPGLVVRDANGEIYTVRYEAVNAMLLNEFLKAHKKIEEQEVSIAQLKNELQATAANQQKQIEALGAGLQKVSGQLQLSRSSPQAVLSDQ